MGRGCSIVNRGTQAEVQMTGRSTRPTLDGSKRDRKMKRDSPSAWGWVRRTASMCLSP